MTKGKIMTVFVQEEDVDGVLSVWTADNQADVYLKTATENEVYSFNIYEGYPKFLDCLEEAGLYNPVKGVEPEITDLINDEVNIHHAYFVDRQGLYGSVEFTSYSTLEDCKAVELAHWREIMEAGEGIKAVMIFWSVDEAIKHCETNDLTNIENKALLDCIDPGWDAETDGLGAFNQAVANVNAEGGTQFIPLGTFYTPPKDQKSDETSDHQEESGEAHVDPADADDIESMSEFIYDQEGDDLDSMDPSAIIRMGNRGFSYTIPDLPNGANISDVHERVAELMVLASEEAITLAHRVMALGIEYDELREQEGMDEVTKEAILLIYSVQRAPLQEVIDEAQKLDEDCPIRDGMTTWILATCVGNDCSYRLNFVIEKDTD